MTIHTMQPRDDSQGVLPLDTADDQLIQSALAVLEQRLRYAPLDNPKMDNPDNVRAYLKLQLAELEHEVFAVLFLDNRHQLIAFEQVFRGTIDGASVHPREIAKLALQYNAAAVIFAHNHPSGIAEPSQADRNITEKLKQSLGLVDVRVLDHVVVGRELVSFAERGLI